MNEQMKSPEAPVNPCAKHTGKILNNDKDVKNRMYRITSVANPDRKSWQTKHYDLIEKGNHNQK